MKYLYQLLVFGFVFFAIFNFVSCGTPPKTDENKDQIAASEAPEPVKELVLEPSAAKPDSKEITAGCLFCHGFFDYEVIRASTANYLYFGDIVQPHVYLDMSKRNSHDSDIPIDCITCHEEHEVPEPLSPVKKANLNYCVNCHHTGDIISCVVCHGTIP